MQVLWYVQALEVRHHCSSRLLALTLRKDLTYHMKKVQRMAVKEVMRAWMMAMDLPT